MPRVCVVGSSNIDLTFRVPRLPRPGETLSTRSFHQGFGGKGANQAVMAARLGATVHMVTRLGRDAFGEQTLRNYQKEGIDTAHVRFDDERPSGVAVIEVDDEARNCILLAAGANEALSPQDVREAAAAIEAADVVLCQLEVPLETTHEALRLARAAGVRTLLNPAPARDLPDDLVQLADLLVPNEIEVEQMTGHHAGTRDIAERGAQALLGRKCGCVIITRGARGVLVVDGRSSEFYPAPPVAAVDPTGAGDAFIGGLAVFLSEGHPLPEAVYRAQAAAALSVTRPGAQMALPARAEVEAFLLERSAVPGSAGG